LERSLETRQNTILSLEKRAEEIQQLQSTIKTQDSTIKTLKKQIENDKTLATNRLKHIEKSHEEDILDFKEKIAKASDLAIRLRDRLFSDREAHRSELQVCQEKLAESTQACDQLAQSLDEAKVDLSRLHAETDASRTQFAALQELVEKLRRKCNKRKSEKEKWRGRCEAIRTRLAAETTLAESLRAEIRQLGQFRQSGGSAVDYEEISNDEEENQRDVELQQTRAQLRAERAEIARLREENNNLQEDLWFAVKKNEELQLEEDEFS
jgi:chromosome segregation protein